MGLEMFKFGWFKDSEKLFFTIRLIIKLDWQNSAHRLRDNYLTNRLVKFLQHRIKTWRVGALRACTSYHDF